MGLRTKEKFVCGAKFNVGKQRKIMDDSMTFNDIDDGLYPTPEIVRNGVAVDIGANGGTFTARVSSFFSMIHSYEPIPLLAERIRNRKLSNVVVYNEAVGDSEGTAKLIMHQNKDSGCTTTQRCIDKVICNHNEWTESAVSEEVPIVDLKTVINRIGGRIDYLKMDCETSEYLILLNKDLQNIRYIAIEVHCQMGKEHWNQLKSWVEKTHKGFPDYSNDSNLECLLTPNSEA